MLTNKNATALKPAGPNGRGFILLQGGGQLEMQRKLKGDARRRLPFHRQEMMEMGFGWPAGRSVRRFGLSG
jgi:hypothetical protein